MQAESYTCCIFQPYRGTDLHDYCVNKGYYSPEMISKTVNSESPLKQPHITKEELLGLKRTFPLYIKFPTSEFDLIKKAEKFDEEGNEIFGELSKIYRKKYELRKGQPRELVSA